MTTGSGPYSPSRSVLLALLAAVLWWPGALFAGDGEFCGRNAPARPVPQCVAGQTFCPSGQSGCNLNDPDCSICIQEVCDGPGAPICCLSDNCSGSVCTPSCSPATLGGESISCGSPEGNPARLWPLPNGAFEPTDTPGQPFPTNRDSTQWTSNTLPGAGSGHELFMSLDVAGNHLYVSYNAGLQVWNIAGGNAGDPSFEEGRDGWMGHFFAFPPPGESDFFVDDIAAIIPPGAVGERWVAVSGKDSVGVSLWRHTVSPSELEQLYQDTVNHTVQVRLAEDGGTVYAFGSGRNGVFVYNVSAAESNPCTEADPDCGSVFRGKLGNMTSGNYLDVMERNGSVFVAATDGDALPGRPLALEIWEVPNPQSPGGASLKFSGFNTDSRGPALFELSNGKAYLAMIDRSGANRTLKIFDITACLNSAGLCTGSTPGPLVWSQPNLPLPTATRNFLTFSESGNDPFLFYGFSSDLLDGTKQERLYDLSPILQNDDPVEITEGGETYFDPCSNKSVDYWGYYYGANQHGFRNASPQVGKFKGAYFYRAAFGFLDVHVRDADVPDPAPVVTTTVDDPPPHYMAQGIDFSATAQNCPGPENWTWNEDDPFTGPGDIVANGSNATITFGLCASNDCPNRQVEVWALKDACSGAGDLVQNRANLTVLEPRPQIREIEVCPQSSPGCPQVPDPEFEVCTALRFTADVDGREPFDYLWTVRDEAGQPIEMSTEEIFAWDTSGIELGPPPAEIFADGFETGDARNWTRVVEDGKSSASERKRFSLPDIAKVDLVDLVAKGDGMADFEIELMTDNSDGDDTASVTVTLTGLGALGFGIPAITPSDQGEGSFQFQADTLSATEWRWEFEDPENGSSAGCLFYSSCVIYDWGEDDDMATYQWATPNVPGLYGVTVSIRNCVEFDPPLSENITVDVTDIMDPIPLGMLTFTVDDPDCDFSFGFWTCPLGNAIFFEATSEGGATAYEFDWDDDGVFDEVIGVGNPIFHTYSTPTTVSPDARALAPGADPSAPLDLFGTILVE